MRVACQAPTFATGRLVFQLKTEGHDEGEDTFEERPPIAKQLEVGCFILKIDGDGPVFSRRFSRCEQNPQSLRHNSLPSTQTTRAFLLLTGGVFPPQIIQVLLSNSTVCAGILELSFI